MDKIIVSPILQDLEKIGFNSTEINIATAYYSRPALSTLQLKSKKINFMCRLDLNSIDEWVSGGIDPKALLEYIKYYSKKLQRRPLLCITKRFLNI